MNAKEALEIMGRWFDEYNPHTEDHEALSVLSAVVEENAAIKAEVKSLKAELEQCRVQLAGCGVAALGWTKDPAKQGDYGWSASYQDVLNLQAELDAARRKIRALERALTETGRGDSQRIRGAQERAKQ